MTEPHVPAHLRNLTPEQREAVRAAAAKELADAPEWTEEQLTRMRPLLARDRPIKKRSAA